VFDYPHNDDAQDYRALCAEAGWNYVTSQRSVHVFCADDSAAEPIPIHTDNRIQNTIFLKHYLKREFLPYLILVLLFAVPFSPLAWTALGAEWFLHDLLIFFALGLPVFALGFAANIAAGLVWFLRALHTHICGLALPKNGYRTGRVISGAMTVGTAIFLVCAAIGIILDGTPVLMILLAINLAGLAIGLIFRRRVAARDKSRGQNIALFAALLVGGVVVAAIIGSILIPRFIPFEWWYVSERAEIMSGRPVITLDALGVDPGQDAFFHANIGGSVAVPVSYWYREHGASWRHYGGWTFWDTVRTEVHTARHSRIAGALFKHYAAPVEEWMPGDLHHMTETEAALWGADKGVMINNHMGRVDLILLRDKTVLCVWTHFEHEVDMELLRQAILPLWDS
jgi:hypothetical protein